MEGKLTYLGVGALPLTSHQMQIEPCMDGNNVCYNHNISIGNSLSSDS